MEMTETPVQQPKNRRWTVEQKMALLQEWRSGTPLAELCRRHGIASWQMD